MTVRRPSRRRVLTAGITAGAVLAAGPAALAGCSGWGPAAPTEPDPLQAPAQRAESDAALAEAVAAAHSALADEAAALAADRQAHAGALRAELRRSQSEQTPVGAAPAAAEPPPVASDQADARDALAGAIRAAQVEASGLVATLPGNRAALLASVAACCASHAVVLP